MYGAILGDIIGSPYEFDQGRKTKVFPLFSEDSEFTDDSVMTIAVAYAFLPVQPEMEDATIRQRVVAKMQKYGRLYPHFAGGSGIGICSLTTAGATALLCESLLSDGCLMILKLCAGWPDSLRK